MTKKLKQTLAMVLLLGMILPGGGIAQEQASLTVMIYMAGSDLETLRGAASTDLAEMVAAGPYPEGIRAVALAGGANEWHNGLNGNQNTLFEVTGEGFADPEETGSGSMGDDRTLSGFIRAARERCPADRYALILWSHGGGPLEGICFDERTQTGSGMDRLTLGEIAAALKEAGCDENKLVFLGFDACVMACAEAACAVSPYADALIASQEPVAFTGWDYGFLGSLRASMTGPEAGKEIVEAYRRTVDDPYVFADIACLNLANWGAVAAAAGDFFAELDGALSGETYPAFEECRRSMRETVSTMEEDLDMVDLGDLVRAAEEWGLAQGSKMREALAGLVSCSWANDEILTGVSLYFPCWNKFRFSASWGAEYDQLDFVPEYRAFVRRYAVLWLPEADAWPDEDALWELAYNNEDYVIYFPEEEGSVLDAAATVLEQTGGLYRWVYVPQEVVTGEDEVFFPYAGDALYALDEAGHILYGPITFSAAGDSLLLTMHLPGEDASQEVEWEPDEEGHYYPRDRREEEAFFESALLSRPEEDLPVSAWPRAGTLQEGPVRLDGSVMLSFLPVWTNADRVAFFELETLDGAATDMVPIDNLSLWPLLAEPAAEEQYGLTVRLNEANLYTQAMKSLEMAFSFGYEGEGEAEMRLSAVLIDETPVLSADWGTKLAANEETAWDILIPARTLKKAGVGQGRTLTLKGTLTCPGEAEKEWVLVFDFPCHLGAIAY